MPLDAMLTDYYRERGWNHRTGVPENETIASLGLTELVGVLT
ncbi:MAG: aldehyde ferredoxin oxidoreductase C-terminal domain-containing protein [Deltaproteobacteria bacterium]|nr:aldehyde ferredoxin oxidoreductase C-terminal domain-containing protein [Deltaproteobacteria bacterium]